MRKVLITLEFEVDEPLSDRLMSMYVDDLEEHLYNAANERCDVIQVVDAWSIVGPKTGGENS